MIILVIIVFLLILIKQFEIVVKQKKYIAVFFFSFILKLVLLVLSENHIFTPVDGGKDAVGFVRESLRLYNTQDVWSLLFESEDSRYGKYPTFLAIVYHFTYPNHLVMLGINILLHNAILIIMFKSIDLLLLRKIEKLILVSLVAFFPILIGYSVILLREIIYIYFISVLILQIIYQKKFNKLYYSNFFLLVLSAIAVYLHAGNITIVIGAWFLFSKMKKVVKLGLIYGFSFILFTLIASGAIGGYFKKINSFGTDNFIENINNGRETSSSRYDKFYGNSLVKNVLIAFPVDFVNFTFQPFIYPISNIYRQLFRYPYGLLSIWMFYVVFKNYRKTGRFEKKMLLLLLAGFLPFIVGSGDVNQAVRHRMNFFTLIIIVIGLFQQSKYLQKKTVNKNEQ